MVLILIPLCLSRNGV